MKKITEEKEEEQQQKHERDSEDTKKDEERHREMEDQALRLMDSTREIELGKNLESHKDEKNAAKKDVKMPKEKKLNPDVMTMDKDGPATLALTEGAMEGQDLLVKERDDKKKKDKKEKHKKRHRLKQGDDEEEPLEEEALDDEYMEDNND